MGGGEAALPAARIKVLAAASTTSSPKRFPVPEIRCEVLCQVRIPDFHPLGSCQNPSPLLSLPPKRFRRRLVLYAAHRVNFQPRSPARMPPGMIARSNWQGCPVPSSDAQRSRIARTESDFSLCSHCPERMCAVPGSCVVVAPALDHVVRFIAKSAAIPQGRSTGERSWHNPATIPCLQGCG